MTALRRFLVTFIAVLFAQTALANPPATPSAGKSWISKSFPFEKDLPVTQQAQQWAMCSATLEVLSDVIKKLGKPDTATTVKNYSNGAAIAIIGVFIMDAIKDIDNLKTEELNTRIQKVVKYAQFASNDYPSAAKSRIGMMRENASTETQFMEDLFTSGASCMKPDVIEMQQAYIDAARQLLIGVGG